MQFAFHLTDYLIAASIGGLTGLSELIARYKSAPGRALKTWPGRNYIIANAFISFFALLMLRQVTPGTTRQIDSTSSPTGTVLVSKAGGSPQLTDQNKISSTNSSVPPSDLVKTTAKDGSSDERSRYLEVLIAGAGAMALFRTSFRFRTGGGQDLEIGLSKTLQAILDVLDRAVDRQIARNRIDSVRKAVANIDFEKSTNLLIATCLGAMQNLDVEEQLAIRKEVETLRKTQDIPDDQKPLLLGLLLDRLVGDQVITVAVTDYMKKSAPVIVKAADSSIAQAIDIQPGQSAENLPTSQ